MVTVLKLGPEDWFRYRSLRLEALATDPAAFGATLAESLTRDEAFWRRRLSDGLHDPCQAILFAEVGHQLVGMLAAARGCDVGTAHLISMYVSPAFRGQGIARRLMDTVLNELREMGGIKTVTLDVNPLQAAAWAFYRSLEFEVYAEERIERSDGSTFTELRMRRPLHVEKV